MIPVQPISRDLRGFDLTAFVSALLEGMRHMTRHGELPADDTISTSPRGHRLIMQYTGADPELFLADMRREFDLGLDLSAPGHVDISEIERYFPGLVDVVAAKFRRQAAAAHERREMTIQVAGRLSAALTVTCLIFWAVPAMREGGPSRIPVWLWITGVPGTLWYLSHLAARPRRGGVALRIQNAVIRNIRSFDPAVLAHALLRGIEHMEATGRAPKPQDVQTTPTGFRLIEQFCGRNDELYRRQIASRFGVLYTVDANGNADFTGVEHRYPGLIDAVLDRLERDVVEAEVVLERGAEATGRASAVLQVVGGMMVLFEQLEILLVDSLVPELTMCVAAPGAIWYACRRLCRKRNVSPSA